MGYLYLFYWETQQASQNNHQSVSRRPQVNWEQKSFQLPMKCSDQQKQPFLAQHKRAVVGEWSNLRQV